MLLKEMDEKAIEKNGKIAALGGVFVWFAAGLVLEELVISLAIAILFAIAIFFVLLYLPELEKKKKAALIERDLAFALMNIAVELKLNVAFEKCIENSSKQEYGLLSKELQKVVREVKREGASMQEALFHFAERTESLMVKRSIAQLAGIYEQGNASSGAESVKRLAAELLSKQRAESKLFSGKLAVFSLLFIAVSAIGPALFQSFVIVGSMVLSLTFSPIEVLLIVTIFFPAIDLGVLYYIKTKTPIFLQG